MHHHGWGHDEQRRKWREPETVLREIGLKPGDTFLDIGCGDGFFALPAARLVGERGLVYGVDIRVEAIESLRASSAREHLENVKLKVGRAEEEILCTGCADIAFIGTALHDFADAAKVLHNIHQMIKPQGVLANLDWKKEPTPFGPPLEYRFSRETASRLITGAGFSVESVKDSGAYFYLVLARLKPKA